MNRSSLAVALALSTAAGPLLAQDLVFDLINQSSYALQHLYVSPQASDTWGDDILGTEVLLSGEQGTVTIADGETVCVYDMLFVTDTGNEVSGSADLCENHAFTLTD